MAKKGKKRRSKKNRVVVSDTTSKENVPNAAMPNGEFGKANNLGKPTATVVAGAPLQEEKKTILQEKVLVVDTFLQQETPTMTLPKEDLVEDGEIVEIFEQVGDEEIRIHDMSEVIATAATTTTIAAVADQEENRDNDNNNNKNLKQVMEQAKMDLKNAGFPGFLGTAIFDPVRDVVLAPALDFSADILPAVAEKIPLAETVGVHALGAVFGIIKFGYGIVPHKKVTATSDGMPSQ